MEDTIDRAELLLRLGNGGAHLIEICYVGLRNQKTAGERTNLDKLAKFILLWFRALVLVHRGIPLCFQRQRGAADENQSGFEFTRQVFGENEAETARAARNEIDASALEAGTRGRRRVEWSKIKAIQSFSVALAATISDGCIFDTARPSRRRVGWRFRRALRSQIDGEIEIDGTAGDAGKFFMNDARWAEQHGAGRITNGFAGNLLHAIGDESDVDASEILRGQSLGEKERTQEAELDGFFQLRFGII